LPTIGEKPLYFVYSECEQLYVATHDDPEKMIERRTLKCPKNAFQNMGVQSVAGRYSKWTSELY
jgi:hypothetical protein